MPARRIGLLSCTLAVWLPLVAWAAQPDPEIANDEKTLQTEGIATDGPTLLALFKARTLSDGDRVAIAATVPKLGDNDFDVREKASQDLIVRGPPAKHFLKAALKDADLEVVRRAKICLEEIRKQKTSLVMSAAARVLAVRQPDGAAAALLAYLPSKDEDAAEEEEALFSALGKVGLRNGKPVPAVTAALTDKVPLRRAAAAYVQGRAATAADRRPVARLLADTDARVRFEAAAALTRSGEKTAVPAVVAQLTDAPEEYAWRAEELLQRLAGDDSPNLSLGSAPAERRRARDAWEAWWRDKGDKADLTKLKNEEPLLGLTLVCEYDGHADGGRVYELGKDGKARWTITGLQGPNDVQRLPGGNVLIAERNGNRVSERDRKGNILWQHIDMQSPIACQRLPGGNTLIATFGELFELSATDNRKVHSLPGNYRYATCLRNRHILFVTSNGEIVELDADWKELRKLTADKLKYAAGAGYWASVEQLPNGRLLVALGGQSRVIEIDWTGKVLLDIAQPNCVFATRLPNGHTLISCFEQKSLVEVDRNGKQLTEIDALGEKRPKVIKLDGRIFTVRRY